MRIFCLLIFVVCCSGTITANQLLRVHCVVTIDDYSSGANVVTQSMVKLTEETALIPIKIIHGNFGKVSVMKATIQGKTYEVAVRSLDENILEGTIELPELLAINDSLPVVIDYRLSKLKPTIVTIPVAFINWKPKTALADAFVAKVQIPANHVLMPSFPALKWKLMDCGDSICYSFSLQAIPSWIRFRSYPGRLPFLTLDRAVDACVIVFLVGLLFWGWKQLNRSTNPML